MRRCFRLPDIVRYFLGQAVLAGDTLEEMKGLERIFIALRWLG
jgi:hypothetical protein